MYLETYRKLVSGANYEHADFQVSSGSRNGVIWVT